MKRRNVKNNVENKIRSILLEVRHFLFKFKKKSTSSTWSYLDIKSNVEAGLVSAQRGITLIALIITIILMLILAGVVLTLTIGENGLFNTAKYAANKWNDSVAQEQEELDKLYAYINGETLPENTKDTIAGTLVAVPDNWKTSTPAYIQTSDGKEVVSSKKVSTVQAVATGLGETVPVPLGFYYVGGKIDTGVVISDNKVDQNKYKNEINIPSGIEAILNEDGSVKEVKETLVGNQFIWVPCKEEEYKKTDWGQGNVANRSNLYWDTTVDKAGKMQTMKYGGFYVARFEAGIEGDIKEFENTNDVYNKEGKPQSKAGLVPWNNIDWSRARENADNMYKTTYVSSGLITGTQWDVMINWMTDKNMQELTNSTFGNYATSTPKINLGRIAYCDAKKQEPYINTWITNTEKPLGVTDFSGHIWTTGASDEAKKKNLYDVAGNSWEWTEETSNYADSTSIQYRVGRGGCFNNNSYSYPICYRYSFYDTTVGIGNGFRVVLYMR